MTDDVDRTKPKEFEPADDSAVFIDQSRWLLEWHNRRSEGIATRALALLAFVGVVLALLLQGAGLKDVQSTPCVWVLLIATLASLVFTAGSAVWTIAPQEVAAPSVNQLRGWWSSYAERPTPGSMARQIANSFLNSSDPDGVSAVADAMRVANNRAERFKVAVRGILASLIGLTLLLAVLLLQTWGN